MIRSAEYVSLGHSDKVADAIASYLLDAYMAQDPSVRFAIEVLLKDNICTIAGEVTSSWSPSEQEITQLVHKAIAEIGYTKEYATRWPQGSTIYADIVEVVNLIGHQSPDIAVGVDGDGWGDQGVFAGMATNEEQYGYMPRDIVIAREIGDTLYNAGKTNEAPIGIDIKVLVTLGRGQTIEQVIIAAPMLPENVGVAQLFIGDVVYEIASKYGYICSHIVINGTGSYIVHSTIGDAGTVGRKLAVDFYGLNCPIGGGSPWGKDPSKADVSLNLVARYQSLVTMLLSKKKYAKVFTYISCCIGKSKVCITQCDEKGSLIGTSWMDVPPSKVIKYHRLNSRTKNVSFFNMCKGGLFSIIDEDTVKGGYKQSPIQVKE